MADCGGQSAPKGDLPFRDQPQVRDPLLSASQAGNPGSIPVTRSTRFRRSATQSTLVLAGGAKATFDFGRASEKRQRQSFKVAQ